MMRLRHFLMPKRFHVVHLKLHCRQSQYRYCRSQTKNTEVVRGIPTGW